MADLLSRIDSALANEDLPSKQGELLARRACYLARLGRFDEARKLIAHVRETFPTSSNPRVSVWVIVAEGILYTFEDLSAEGHDRMMRAQTLAVAMRDRPLVAWASAWRAHLLSERSDFVGMARSLEGAFAACADDEHEAIARASMVLANAYATCGERDLARRWYASSRHHALEVGDQATIDALIYNKAAFTMGWLRAEACFSLADESALAQAAGEISSARNYQNLIGIRAVSNFADLWSARLALLQGRYREAIAALNDVRHKEPFASYNFDQAVIDMEIAFCHYRLDDLASATKLAPHRETDLSGLHRDEQLVAAWLRAQMAAIAPSETHKDRLHSDLDAAKSAYRGEQDGLRAEIARFDGAVPPGVPSAVVNQASRGIR